MAPLPAQTMRQEIKAVRHKPEFRDRHGQGHQFAVKASEVVQVVPKAVSDAEVWCRRVDYAHLGTACDWL